MRGETGVVDCSVSAVREERKPGGSWDSEGENCLFVAVFIRAACFLWLSTWNAEMGWVQGVVFVSEPSSKTFFDVPTEHLSSPFSFCCVYCSVVYPPYGSERSKHFLIKLIKASF